MTTSTTRPRPWSRWAGKTGTTSSRPPGTARVAGERIVVNMGPQHPSTHGVLRLILEIEGETITEARCGIGYLHTGIEKNLEYRNWTQGVTFVTRMDYLSPFFNETAYCLGVEKLLDVTDDIPERASVIRVLLMELNRISSHLVALATGGMELGAMSAMFFGFRGREQVLAVFETITGLRMNHAYIRPGGLAADLPDEAMPQLERAAADLPAKRCRSGEPAQRELHLEGPHPGHRLPGPDRVHGARHHRADACAPPACRTTCAAPSPTAATRTTNSTSSPTDECDAYGRYMIRVARDAGVAQDRRAVPRPAQARAGDDHRQEAGLARRPQTRARRPGQLARAHRQDHGRLDGGA